MLFCWTVFLLFLAVLMAESATTEAPASSNSWVWILIILIVIVVTIGAVLLILRKKGKLCRKKMTPPQKKTPVLKELKTTTVKAPSTIESPKEASSNSSSKQSVGERVQQKAETKETKTEDKKEEAMERGKKEEMPRSGGDREEIVEAIGTVKGGPWQMVDEVDQFSFDISSKTE